MLQSITVGLNYHLIRLVVFLAVFAMTTLLHATPIVAQTRESVSSNANTQRPDAGQSNSDRSESGQSDWAVAELVRIEEQMRQINDQLTRLDAGASAAGRLEEASRSLDELRESPGLACGAAGPVRTNFIESLERTVMSLRGVSASMPTLYPWEEADLNQLREICGQPLLDTLRRMDEGVADITNDIAASTSSRSELENALANLEQRKRQIITQMSNTVASARITRTMPWILVIIAVLGVGMMAGVRLFSPNIQSELICSGQLVQFVTILILFGALLALGLADKLQEQTLAALLGGLAGYVLSQGIGHKERQSALQTIRTINERLGGPAPDSFGQGREGGEGNARTGEDITAAQERADRDAGR